MTRIRLLVLTGGPLVAPAALTPSVAGAWEC